MAKKGSNFTVCNILSVRRFAVPSEKIVCKWVYVRVVPFGCCKTSQANRCTVDSQDIIDLKCTSWGKTDNSYKVSCRGEIIRRRTQKWWKKTKILNIFFNFCLSHNFAKTIPILSVFGMTAYRSSNALAEEIYDVTDAKSRRINGLNCQLSGGFVILYDLPSS